MTLPMAAWRVTYTPGDWLVLSGPTMLVVMLPAPPRMSQLVNALWDDVVAARSVDALLALFGQYGLDGMPDFAAFFWDVAGLHGMARGRINVVDTETGDTVVTGSDVVTWREEALGSTRHLRVDMQAVDQDVSVQLPLVVGAVNASAIYLTTDPASQVRFPDGEQLGVLARVPMLGVRPMESTEPDVDVPVDLVGLGDETEMEPYEEPEPEPDPGTVPQTESVPESPPESEPQPDLDTRPVPVPVPEPEPAPEPAADQEPKFPSEPEPDVRGLQQLQFDADEALQSMPTPNEPIHDEPAAPQAPSLASLPDMPIPPPSAQAPVVVARTFQVGDDDEGGTIFSTGLAATHKPPTAAVEEQAQVLAVPCARGHANPQGSRSCRICSAPVDSSNPRLINRPPLAGVHSNKGEFANLQVAVLVGRSPDASKAPRGAHLMRVPSPSSDISRSHLLVAPRDWSVIVTDLNSTNGTTVIPVGEQPFVLTNGESVQVDMGTVLDLGDGVSLRIEPPRG